MIYRHMYVAYIDKEDVTLKDCDRVNTVTLGYYDNLAVLYFETSDSTLVPESFTEGSVLPLPDGRLWMEASDIYHSFSPEDESRWERKIPDKKCYIQINRLKRDKISSYIYYHVERQNDNLLCSDKYLAVYIHEDLIFLYGESPGERMTWEDIEGKNHHCSRYDWAKLMDEHFRTWQDGTKGWKALKCNT